VPINISSPNRRGLRHEGQGTVDLIKVLLVHVKLDA
jgi:hypothetical protein